MVNEHQDGVEKRQAETPELFRPTAQQEAAAAEVEEKAKSEKKQKPYLLNNPGGSFVVGASAP